MRSRIDGFLRTLAVARPGFAALGEATPLSPAVFKESYRIAREAFINAFQNSQAQKVEAEVTYLESGISIRVRDDGIDVGPDTMSKGTRGALGLSRIRERAVGSGPEVELTIPSRIAYLQSVKQSLWQRIRAALSSYQENRG